MPAALAPDLQSGSVQAPATASNPDVRFTPNGSNTLEQHLANVCKAVLAGVGRVIPAPKLEGIALGGGYGRGEGGVLETPAGDRPYNDLEFYVLARGHPWWNEQRYAKSLHALATELALDAGLELEFKITSRAKLRLSPQNLFDYDFVMGHRWLLGDDRLLAGSEHHREAESIPLSEATRLLMNRCSGLLFACKRLENVSFSAEDADFVSRNIAKTELALGDAVLIAFGRYDWSCLERGRRLKHLTVTEVMPWLEEVRRRHAAGIEFKLQPYRSQLPREALQEHFRRVSSLALRLWLWLENRRLGGRFQSAVDYATSRTNKWPGSSGWRNRLANARVFGLRALLIPRNGRHPRERILNALALLLWGRAEAYPRLSSKVQRELLWTESAAIIHAYRERWRQAS